MAITHLLFDVGGVLIAPLIPHEVAQRRDQLAHQLGYPDGRTMWLEFYTGPEWFGAKTGSSTHQKMWDQLLSPHGLTTPQAQQQFINTLFQGEGVHPDMYRLLDELNGRYPLSILSNADDILERRLAHYNLAHYFNPIINSHRIGVAKPEPAAYQAALDALQTAAENILFIDNLARNTIAATELGFQTHLYTTVTNLRQDLHQRQLL
ncbi:MAG TPA: HAD-IA family hydrolase [Anaerolineae bacterium]|nr:HAD-IA family hydrolase [Anaerolineae bacterium]